MKYLSHLSFFHRTNLYVFLLLFVIFLLLGRQTLAQSVNSNCIDTPIGSPGIGDPPSNCTGAEGSGNGNGNSGSGSISGAPGGGSANCGSTPPSDYRQALIDKFGVTMDSAFSQTTLKATWDKFCDISNTKFDDLVKGVTVHYLSSVGGSHGGCYTPGVKEVWIGELQNPDYFKFLLFHELGHVVYWCNPRSATHADEAANALAAEGALTYYAAHAHECTGSDTTNEDYAEMITYYLNPSAGFATAACSPDQSPPNPYFGLNQFPQHLSVVKSVLD